MTSLEGFVRASGTAMGIARESFGAGGVALAPPPDGDAAPGAPDTSGRAADSAAEDSRQVHTDVTTLHGHDSQGHGQLSGAAAASAAGRSRMDAVIAAAVADVNALGMSTNTPQGKAELIKAITRHLEDSKTTVDGAAADAGTRAANANTTAAGYNATAPMRSPAMSLPQAAQMMGSAVPGAAGMATSPMQMLSGLGGAMPLSSLAQLMKPGGSSSDPAAANDPQAGSPDAVLSSDPTVAGGAVRRALAQLGKPYVWGSKGPASFDCSGLVQYAYRGVGVDLPGDTYGQIRVGQQVPADQAQAGDLVFSHFDGRGPGHVQLALGGGHVVEAQQTGVPVKISPMPSGHVVVKRVVT